MVQQLRLPLMAARKSRPLKTARIRTYDTLCIDPTVVSFTAEIDFSGKEEQTQTNRD